MAVVNTRAAWRAAVTEREHLPGLQVGGFSASGPVPRGSLAPGASEPRSPGVGSLWPVSCDKQLARPHRAQGPAWRTMKSSLSCRHRVQFLPLLWVSRLLLGTGCLLPPGRRWRLGMTWPSGLGLASFSIQSPLPQLSRPSSPVPSSWPLQNSAQPPPGSPPGSAFASPCTVESQSRKALKVPRQP